MTTLSERHTSQSSEIARLRGRVRGLALSVVVLVVALLGVGAWTVYDSVAAGEDSMAAGERVFVSGTSGGDECTWSGMRGRNDDDPATHVWMGTLMCPSEMSDTRVSGIEEWELVEPFYYTEYLGEPHSGRFEASITLSTDEGAWRGEGFGSDLWRSGQSGLKTTFYAEYAGEGAYEGLIYREWGTQYPGSNGYWITGYIEPAE